MFIGHSQVIYVDLAASLFELLQLVSGKTPDYGLVQQRNKSNEIATGKQIGDIVIVRLISRIGGSLIKCLTEDTEQFAK